MPTSVFGPDVNAALAIVPSTTTVVLPSGRVTLPTPFPSPEDWRDQWIYSLMVDRFCNTQNPPRSTTRQPAVAWDQPFGEFQGGTFAGVVAQLDYLKQLGVGALWLTPVLKNCQYEAGTFHGYGIQDFLTVEPRFGTTPAVASNELRSLVDAAHARGIYVILDIVLNHAGNVFGYVRDGLQNAPGAPFAEQPYMIAWHDGNGQPFTSVLPGAELVQPDAAVWPQELQRNAAFRRQGKGADVPRAHGDFESLKQLVSEDRDANRVLIRAYQYVIAAFDVDGFRIDTFKLPDPDFGHTFCASMREFALSIGKKNFFTFGEITTGEEGLAAFIGRDTKDATSDTIGIDAALDFSLEGCLNDVIKGLQPMSPLALAQLYAERKRVERTVITTHGEASGFFVTFLDNHDRKQRFYFQDPANPPRFDQQLTMALACLFSLQGIPAVYYGTEQGLHGIGNSDAAVREALWGKPAPTFDTTHAFYQYLGALAQVRASHPALWYGRQYFRQVSGNAIEFGISSFAPGVLAFSRILDAQEVVTIANPTPQDFIGDVLVDADLNVDAAIFRLALSNQGAPQSPGAVRTHVFGTVQVHELDGTTTPGPIRAIPVTIRSGEVQILSNR